MRSSTPRRVAVCLVALTALALGPAPSASASVSVSFDVTAVLVAPGDLPCLGCKPSPLSWTFVGEAEEVGSGATWIMTFTRYPFPQGGVTFGPFELRQTDGATIVRGYANYSAWTWYADTASGRFANLAGPGTGELSSPAGLCVPDDFGCEPPVLQGRVTFTLG